VLVPTSMVETRMPQDKRTPRRGGRRGVSYGDVALVYLPLSVRM